MKIVIPKRNLVIMFFLLVFTGGLYFLYWQYKTKEEINSIGGKIPTFFFAILPFFNIYFDYRYAQYFVRYIRKERDPVLEIVYFLLLLCLPMFALFIIQYELNRFVEKH